ncbi:MAG: OadG-related small transporter subunit [Bacteroidales bacterium]
MKTDFLKSLELMGEGMTAIFVVIIVIYLAVHLILKLSGGRKKEGTAGE